MSFFRPVGVIDVFFIGGVFLLWASVIGFSSDREPVARPLGVLGWAVLGAFWFYTSSQYLVRSRFFLGTIGVVTVVLNFYAASLVARHHTPGERLTVAFSVMGALFLPFEFVGPIHRTVLATVASHAALGLSLVGFEPIIGYGSQGYANVIYFQGMSAKYGIRIISACSGISAIALFVGVVAASRASLRRRFVGAIGVSVVIYLLNVVRAMFVAGSIGGGWFGFAASLTRFLHGGVDPRIASYYVAEYFVSQILVVVVLLWVYLRLTTFISEIQALVDSLLEAASTDFRNLVD